MSADAGIASRIQETGLVAGLLDVALERLCQILVLHPRHNQTITAQSFPGTRQSVPT